MPLLPSVKGPAEKRRELAEEMWALCQRVYPTIYRDMQRVALMKYWDKEYFKTAFHEVSEDFNIIACFGAELRNWDRKKLDSWSLKDRWLKLRVIFAKFMNQSDPKFAKIEEHYNFLSLRSLPKITPGQRPKPLPREWWDNHPNRKYTLDRIALVWWRLPEAPHSNFEELCGADVGQDKNNGETKLEKALDKSMFKQVQDVKSIITNQENGLHYFKSD